MLPFASSHMKNNVEVIPFHIRSGGVQDLVFMQITFDKCGTTFCLENSKVAIKGTILNF